MAGLEKESHRYLQYGPGPGPGLTTSPKSIHIPLVPVCSDPKPLRQWTLLLVLVKTKPRPREGLGLVDVPPTRFRFRSKEPA